jgi:serine/threonine-protein kinase
VSGAADGKAVIANRYDIEQELASGGMGVVYRVRDRSTDQPRALKRLKADAKNTPELVEAFEREYQVLASLRHPRIIRVFDYGIDAAGPYYTMELLDGQDMRKVAPLPFQQACLCLRDVGTSLALLHARRLLHRDISPRNVRMTIDGRCKLIDFGALATFGSASAVVGTAPAIPPEALEGVGLDQRSDLYALGALAYWMLTGRHAYPAHKLEELPAMWRTAPPPPSDFAKDVPPELDELVLSLLSVDPHGRPASVVEVISRVSLVADLATEGAQDIERLAESFLVSTPFVGRAVALSQARERVDALAEGRGGALRIEAAQGMGRSRMLEEIAVRAQLAGAVVVCVDASTYRDWSGTARALALRALEVLPRWRSA